MNIQAMGTASGYVKNMALNMKWQERKLDPKKPKENEIKNEDPLIADFRRQMEGNERAQKIESLKGKLLSGKRLTTEEMDYLRENSPDDYENAVKAQKERAEYERELKACMSKEDVAKLNMRRLNRFGAEAKTVAGNPNIPAGKKKTLIEGICMRMTGVMEKHGEFVKTPEYTSLPDKLEDGDERAVEAVPWEDGESGIHETNDPRDGFGEGEIEKLLNALTDAGAAVSSGKANHGTKIEAAAKPAVIYDSKGVQAPQVKSETVSIKA